MLRRWLHVVAMGLGGDGMWSIPASTVVFVLASLLLSNYFGVRCGVS